MSEVLSQKDDLDVKDTIDIFIESEAFTVQPQVAKT
jgi:hypothetical protein